MYSLKHQSDAFMVEMRTTGQFPTGPTRVFFVDTTHLASHVCGDWHDVSGEVTNINKPQ